MSEAQFKHLFSPLKIGQITVRNRIVSTAHAAGFLDADGLPGDRMNNYWGSKARGGIGLIVTQVHNVHPSNGPVPFRDEACVPKFRRTAQIMNEYGAKLIVQLWHAGAQGGGLGGRAIWAPSAVPTPRGWNIPHEMTKDEIKEVIDGYSFAAAKVREAGCDGVEIHGAHGYLITEFTSGFFNRRTDEYGGSLENRMRFISEVVDGVRAAVGRDYTVGLRFSADEFIERGLTLDESVIILSRLAATGKLDYLNVSVGNYHSMSTIIAPMYIPLGAFVYAAAAVKAEVDIPVFCIGRINDPVQAEQILANNQADMVGMTRAHIADPELPNKARTGRLREIRKCQACNEACWGRGYLGLHGISCIINPSVGREGEWFDLKPAAVKKRVMVIGGGVAGLEAARVAALRGHQVSLWEKEKELGGQVPIAAKAPDRIDFGEIVRWSEYQMNLAGVEMHLGEEVTVDTVKKVNPDAVVVATGSSPYIPDIPGIDQPNVTEVRAVLSEKVEVGDRVVILAGDHHQQGLSTADFLASKGKKVTVITPLHFAGQEIEHNTITLLYPRLLEKGVDFIPTSSVTRISGDKVVVSNNYTKEESVIEGVDTVIVAYGGKAENALYRALKGQVKEIHAAGDCVAPRRVYFATYDGGRIGREL